LTRGLLGLLEGSDFFAEFLELKEDFGKARFGHG
jgi:hypothetical protein